MSVTNRMGRPERFGPKKNQDRCQYVGLRSIYGYAHSKFFVL